MPGVCIHEFFWPLRAADGHYYQVCRFCGVQCEYDWNGWFGLEPAHRVFFRNLADTLRAAQLDAARFRSWSYWREVLVSSGAPWRRFGESLLCHVIALAVVVILSQPGILPDQPRRRSIYENYHLSYYKPSGSFPALRGSPSRARQPFRKPTDSARRGQIHVAPERVQAAVNAPNLKLAAPARPNIMASSLVAPVVPMASTGRSQMTGPTAPTSVVAPPPEVSQATSRRLGLAQAPVVAPAPELGARFIAVGDERRRGGGHWASTHRASLNAQTGRTQHRPVCSSRTLAAVADGRAACLRGISPVVTGQSDRIGRAADAVGASLRKPRWRTLGLAVRGRFASRSASTINSECRQLGWSRTPDVILRRRYAGCATRSISSRRQFGHGPARWGNSRYRLTRCTARTIGWRRRKLRS